MKPVSIMNVTNILISVKDIGEIVWNIEHLKKFDVIKYFSDKTRQLNEIQDLREINRHIHRNVEYVKSLV